MTEATWEQGGGGVVRNRAPTQHCLEAGVLTQDTFYLQSATEDSQEDSVAGTEITR